MLAANGGLGTTYYIVATWSGGGARTYVNGVEDSNKVTTSITPGEVTNLRLGRKNDAAPTASVSFGGRMDEVRLSSIARGPEWIATEYANQSSPSTFYSLGPLETLTSP